MHGLLQCAQRLQQNLVERLPLQPVAIEPELALSRGVLRGTPVAMSTQRYSGPGFQSLTIAIISDPTDRTQPTPTTAQAGEQSASTLTVVGLPWPASGLPVFGMDLIALRGSLSLCAIDLAPTDHNTWQGRCAPLLQRLRDQTADVVVPRRPPTFTEGTFSPLALIVAARPGGEATLFRAILQFIDDVAQLVESSCPPARDRATTTDLQTAPAIARWLAAERQNRKEHNALSQIFGEAFAQRYLHSFLFAPPDSTPPERSQP